MWGAILGAILPALIGGMSGGNQESGNDSQISGNDSQKAGQLEKYIGDMLQNGMPQYKGDTTAEFNMPDYMNDVVSQYQQGAGEYEGDLNVDPSQMQNQLSDMVSSCLLYTSPSPRDRS